MSESAWHELDESSTLDRFEILMGDRDAVRDEVFQIVVSKSPKRGTTSLFSAHSAGNECLWPLGIAARQFALEPVVIPHVLRR